MHLTDITDSFIAAGRGAAEAARLPDAAIAIGVAMNHVNRAVGQPDLHPFVSTALTRENLAIARRWRSTPP